MSADEANVEEEELIERHRESRDWFYVMHQAAATAGTTIGLSFGPMRTAAR